ncbi:GDSL esterase/lipase At5g33370-like isoform X2 [Typha latifolia]|uniref:GDSL esterase/lipase At5g33370-like isoform X2 n=1 Tax=Typha latifolia TaxID=4733 RepID=UPI003C2B822A
MASWVLFFPLFVALAAFAALPVSDAARAFFVFGDSLVDNGNNNYLATTARADAPPYGIDYPTHRATGRFSNGLNIPDIISEHLGAEPTLPYLSPQLDGEKLLVGANFASAGIGILNDTGIQFVNIIRIRGQLSYFAQYQQRLSSLIGADQATRLVNGALVLVTLGGNDFVNNYYLVPYSVRSREFALPDYVRYLMVEYKKILARLYELGARRVLVTGTGPLGCVPAELALRSRNGQCDPELMRAADLFNPQMVQMLGELNGELGSDVFIAVNAFKMHMDFITKPEDYDCMLRPRALQWDWAVHDALQRVPQPGRVRLLGRLPPDGESQPVHRGPVHERINRVHEPHEPQHHPPTGFQNLELCEDFFLSFPQVAMDLLLFPSSRFPCFLNSCCLVVSARYWIYGRRGIRCLNVCGFRDVLEGVLL